MTTAFLRCALLLLLSAPALAAAQTADVVALMHDNRWAEAEQAVAPYADPVARKLVLFYRLLTPAAASAAEIADFMAGNPEWPLQASLAVRRDAALASEPDDAVVLGLCDHADPQGYAALARCADADRHAGRMLAATAAARRAWVAAPADAAVETQLLQRLAGLLAGADQLARFDRLAWSDSAAAQRQLARLDPADRPPAAARLALRRDDPQAAMLLAALLPGRVSPGLMLEQARWLRRAGQDDAALALWRDAGAPAEHAAPPERLAAFWDERNLLSRRRLRAGDAAGAYALAAGFTGTAGEAHLDAAFLAGFVALRLLHDPATARAHFAALADASAAAITQARAAYWLGRAAPDATAARAAFAQAAAWPGTYYGQLATLWLGADLPAAIQAARDPAADPDRALAFAGRELTRAAAYLVAWGAARRAPPFLLRLGDIGPAPADRGLAARLAEGFGLPETAVGVARRAGRDGVVLLRAGWPQPFEPPPEPGLDPALALAVMRQESSFDPGTISPVGARGLMQLMPATAAAQAHLLGLPAVPPALLQDPATNMRLGGAYLHGLLDRYAGAVPLAVAAYNAGPGRVNEWLATNGDPRAAADPGGIDMIDWIELIPFSETRNYVQRVIENAAVYAARRPASAPHPLAAWSR